MDTARSKYVPQRKILFVSAFVDLVTTEAMAGVTAAQDAVRGICLLADVPKRKIRFAGIAVGVEVKLRIC